MHAKVALLGESQGEMMSALEGPVYNQVIGVASDITDRTVTFAIGINPREGISANITLGLVGPLVAALTAEARKVSADIKDPAGMDAPTLNCSAVWLSQDVEGSPMLVFELIGGGVLPLAMKNVDLSVLASEMALLAKQHLGRPN